MIDYKTWGADGIDEPSHTQMRDACALPVTRAAALMPDAHLGYGVPIGAVVGLEDALSPGAVGVDIGCQVRMSIFDILPEKLNTRFEVFRNALQDNTFFGVGAESNRYNHEVMKDWLWDALPVLKDNKERAKRQLGTSGGGNHFAEWGVLTVPEKSILALEIEPGQYVALMTHGGSRGTGYAVAERYCDLANEQHPGYFGLAWLDFGSAEGQEYFEAMNLMGRYADANHWLIHSQISRQIGFEPVSEVTSMHNFAWMEEHGNSPMFVHRKGATPAADGEVGIIPGSMGTPAYVVSGLGNPDSLCSASHGAGRKMSRSQAKKAFNYEHEWRKLFEEKGIVIMGGDADELPGAYKEIEAVMDAQADLVRKEAKFDPAIVLMAGKPGAV
jgi:tRNA-splicing ligase RtcB